MAGTPIVQVPGLCLVQVKFAVALSTVLTDLGYARNDIHVTEEAYYHNVPGDANGGDDGPPIDIQILGMTARIRLELTKWDITTANAIRARVDNGTLGTPPDTGTLMFQDSKSFQLYINTPNAAFDMHFPRVVARAPIEVGRGTKFATLVCELEAHKNASGVLWDTTMT